MNKPNHKPAQRWPLLKVVASLAVAVLLFGAGVSVGRGDLKINGLSENPKLPTELNYSSVDQVYDLLRSDFDGNLDPTKLINGAKEGLVAATGDPYTEYFNPTDAKDFNQELSGTISGIGAQLDADANGEVVVVSPIAGFPAAKAGLKPKDVIAAVDNKSTSGKSVDSVVDEIRGPAGTKVTLSIVRDGGNPFDVTITRQNITIPSVTWREADGIGYMTINQFTSDTGNLATKAAKEFKSKGVKAVVLDLRGNPGGYLDAAVKVSSLWLEPNQTVVSERRGSTVIDTEKADGDDLLHGLPTVVLIDGGSASASEITAGALHDNHDAVLVGQKSFGKGSVQEVEHLSDGSEIKITIARWYTPDGKNIDKQGITPDILVKAGSQAGQDPQLDKATQIVKGRL